MPIALELFVGLDKSVLIDGTWVPLSWDEKGIKVIVDEPSNPEKRAAIKNVLKTEWVIFTAGVKEDIEACINRSFSQLKIDDFFSRAMSGKEPIDAAKLVDILISEATPKALQISSLNPRRCPVKIACSFGWTAFIGNI